MIRNVKVALSPEKVIHLFRCHSKIGEIITWEVLSEDRKTRLGVIRKVNDHWRTKRVGCQSFPIKYWIGSRFWPKEGIHVGNTRLELLYKMYLPTDKFGSKTFNE